MRLRLAALLGVALLAACGGDETSTASGAGVVPADAAAYVEIDSSLDSEQWQRVEDLYGRVAPGKPFFLEDPRQDFLPEGLSFEDDVEPALGDTVVLAWPKGGDEGRDVVLLTQPDDVGKWRSLIDEAAKQEDERYVLGEKDGWHAVAENQAALDAILEGDGSLAGDDGFAAALEQLPDERIATVWARGDVFDEAVPLLPQGGKPEWVAAAAEAREDGPALTLAVRAPDAGGEAYRSERVEQAPSDALALLSFEPDAYGEQLERLPAPFRDLVAELEGEGAIWVRPGSGLVEVTGVFGARDPGRARAALDRLRALVPQGLPAELRTGVVDGDVVVTTGPSVEAAVREPSESLGESDDFRVAREAAGMPDETSGFLFVDVADALPLLGLAGLAGVELPRELTDGLRALRSLTVWSEGSGDSGRVTLFLHIQ